MDGEIDTPDPGREKKASFEGFQALLFWLWWQRLFQQTEKIQS